MSTVLTKLTHSPHDVYSAQDYRAYAEPRLSADVWRYLQQGERALDQQAFAASTIVPRPLRPLVHGNTQCELFGQRYAHPLLLAPIAYQRLFHDMGECASALAANAQVGNMLVSSLASQTLEDIIEAAEQPLWFQLYWQGDRARTLRLLKRALTAGYNTVVFTVDAAVKPVSIQLPNTIRAVNLEAAVNMPNHVFDGWMAQAPTWDDVAWLREQCSVPLLLKGIMHADDAQRATALGCDGLIVSNHGGRVLASAPSSLAVLPQIVAAVTVPVLLDSGIRHGVDVFKAIRAGAAAVLIGRPYIWGLASCGALGVAHVLRLLRDELELTMAQAGCASLQEVRCGK